LARTASVLLLSWMGTPWVPTARISCGYLRPSVSRGIGVLCICTSFGSLRMPWINDYANVLEVRFKVKEASFLPIWSHPGWVLPSIVELNCHVQQQFDLRKIGPNRKKPFLECVACANQHGFLSHFRPKLAASFCAALVVSSLMVRKVKQSGQCRFIPGQKTHGMLFAIASGNLAMGGGGRV
jgi:hypothetical protein